MVLANVIRTTILLPDRWNTLAIDRNMIQGIYESIRILLIENPNGNIIDANGCLEVYSFDVIQRDFTAFNNGFSINCGRENPFYSSLQYIVNRSGTIGMMLKRALVRLFDVLFINGKSKCFNYILHFALSNFKGLILKLN